MEPRTSRDGGRGLLRLRTPERGWVRPHRNGQQCNLGALPCTASLSCLHCSGLSCRAGARNASEIFIPCPPCPSGSFSRRNRFGYEPAFHCRRSWHATPFFDAAPEPLARRSGLLAGAAAASFPCPHPCCWLGAGWGSAERGEATRLDPFRSYDCHSRRACPAGNIRLHAGRCAWQ